MAFGQLGQRWDSNVQIHAVVLCMQIERATAMGMAKTAAAMKAVSDDDVFSAQSSVAQFLREHRLGR